MSLEIKDLTYTYMVKTPFERTALKDVSLTIEKSEFTAIVGHTGSGKSTLVQHLNGLLSPTRGTVVVDGVDINSKKREARQARRKVGMVFQYPEHQLFEETVYNDIAFGPRNMELAEAEVEARVKKAMEFVRLDYTDYKDRSPFQLSGGQMRRVAIAGVIALQPEYLVLDEPTAGLDPRGREDLLGKICQLHREAKVGVVLVSHNMDDVARLADRVIVMNHGAVMLSDSPRKVFQRAAELAEAGLAVPQITALLHTLQQQGLNVNPEIFNIEQGIENIMKALKEAGKC